MALILITGCRTPYQPNGFSGGYENTDLGGGRHAIEVGVNSFTSQGTAMQYAHRRADELCPAGYEVIDGSKTQTDHYMRTGNTVRNAPKSQVALIVQCTRPVEPVVQRPAEPASDERNVIEGTRPIYCTVSQSNSKIGLCYLDPEQCNSVREGLRSDPLNYVDCIDFKAAACFNATEVLSGTRQTTCAVSISNCDALLEARRASVDFKVTAKRCGIYRVMQ